MSTSRLQPAFTHHRDSPRDPSDLHHEVRGPASDDRERTPVVFVHGSWTDADSWQLVVPAIAAQRVTVVYDRRGHSRSARAWHEPVSRRHDEDDLIGLIEHVGPRAHLVGNSYGASIALAVAARRPDLVASVVGHEPPLLGVVPPSTPLGRDLIDLQVLGRAIGAMIERGEAAGGAERFTDAVLGAGAWAFLPAETRATFVANAATFAGMVRDPFYDQVPDLAGHAMPIVLTAGTESPAWLPAIVDAIAAAHPSITREVYRGAGHVPHLTHPDAVVASVTRVVEAAERALPVGV